MRGLAHLRPLVVARMCSLGGVVASTLLALWLVPQITALGGDTEGWRLGLTIAATLFGAALFGWTRLRLGVLDDPTADALTRRRAAHDFPFRLARLCFVAAVLAGIATATFLWWTGDDAARAAVSGAVTYLLLVFPVLGIYLLTRRALRPYAAGPPGAPPVAGHRQTVALRLAFAVQLPVVVCAVGIVLVEQSNGNVYARDLETYARQRYDLLLGRTLRVLERPEARRALVESLQPPPGVVARVEPDGSIRHAALTVSEQHVRPLALRLPPYLLLGLVTLLSALLGTWLAREVTTELDDVERALRRLGDVSPPSEPVTMERSIALRETAALVSAFAETVAGFRERRAAIREAALQRRRGEQAKSRFLAHMSHELKSPLNSILGFAELLLAGLEGELTPRQREQLAFIWRSGDALLRFILALLDLARLEAPVGDDAERASGLRPRPTTAAELLEQARQQHRPDPLGAIELTFAPAPDLACEADVEHSARTLVLAGCILLDAMERGEVEVVAGRGTGGHLDFSVRVVSAEGDEADRLQLIAQLTTDWPGVLPEDTDQRFGAAAATLMLLRWLAEVQGGSFDVVEGRWPGFVLRLPAA